MSHRLDRLLTLYFFGPLANLFPLRKGIRIPFLMYHDISNEKGSGQPYFRINISPTKFALQIIFLNNNQYLKGLAGDLA